MKRSDAFKSNYLGKGDLDKPVIATIKDVYIEKIKGDDGDEEKAVCHFTNGTKPMILNVGNWATLEAAYGEESDNWRGRQVEIYVDPNVMFGRDRVGGVRMRIPSSRAAVATTQPAVTDPNLEMRAAWTGFKIKFRDGTKEEQAAIFKEKIKAYFNKPPELLTAAEWRQFALDGFEPSDIPVGVVSNEKIFEPEDVPF